MPTQEDLKRAVYDQQGMVNSLSKAKDPESKKALDLIKPQYEQNLSLYQQAVKKYKRK